MTKTHLQHPTQTFACGAPASCGGVARTELGFDLTSPEERCRRCEKVLIAARAGRKVFAGHDDGAGDVGARKISKREA